MAMASSSILHPFKISIPPISTKNEVKTFHHSSKILAFTRIDAKVETRNSLIHTFKSSFYSSYPSFSTFHFTNSRRKRLTTVANSLENSENDSSNSLSNENSNSLFEDSESEESKASAVVTEEPVKDKRRRRKSKTEEDVEAIPFWQKDSRFANMSKLEFAEIVRKFNLEDAEPPWEVKIGEEQKFALDNLQHGKDEVEVDEEWMERLTAKGMAKRRKEAEEKEEEQNRSELELTEEEEKEWQKLLEESNSHVNQFYLKPPRDWPPSGWEVDAAELAFIHGGDYLEDLRIKEEYMIDRGEIGEDGLSEEEIEDSFPRWNMFFKQYCEWVMANKERLDEESAMLDPEYYPGRRKVGEIYEEGSYELPFIEPGQVYQGVISAVHLKEGAFVDIGCVYDGWVPILETDWFLLRDYITINLPVVVEVVAKRDPYRYRFPVELRLLEPNIDECITRRFNFPPIFGRPDDTNLEDLARETGRPIVPEPKKILKNQNNFDEHPYCSTLRKVYKAEEEMLDEEERSGQISSLIKEKYSIQIDLNLLDLDTAREERKKERLSLSDDISDDESAPTRLQKMLTHLNSMHIQRQLAMQDALKRDESIRKELQLPTIEPNRYIENFEFEEDKGLQSLDDVEDWGKHFSASKNVADTPEPEVEVEEAPAVWPNLNEAKSPVVDISSTNVTET